MPKRKAHQKGKPTSQSSSQAFPNTIFFYLPKELPYGIFCQWHPSPIRMPTISLQFLADFSHDPTIASTILSTAQDGKNKCIDFGCAEQVYMFSKALFFADAYIASLILSNPDPKEQKKLSLRVRDFDAEKWLRHKFRAAVVGNWYKYAQNDAMRGVLLGTGEKELVEAGRKDRVWGIGFRGDEAEENRELWGTNLLGRALMIVRARIRTTGKEGNIIEGVEWDGEGVVSGLDEEEEGGEEQNNVEGAVGHSTEVDHPEEGVDSGEIVRD